MQQPDLPQVLVEDVLWAGSRNTVCKNLRRQLVTAARGMPPGPRFKLASREAPTIPSGPSSSCPPNGDGSVLDLAGNALDDLETLTHTCRCLPASGECRLAGTSVGAWEPRQIAISPTSQARWLLTLTSAVWRRFQVFALHGVAEGARAKVAKDEVAA